MISYELYSQIRLLHQERGLNFAQIARELNLDEETVAKWARAKSYTQRSSNTQRKSKLDPYKVIIQRWLERHSYTAGQESGSCRARIQAAMPSAISTVNPRRSVAPFFSHCFFHSAWMEHDAEACSNSLDQYRGLKIGL